MRRYIGFYYIVGILFLLLPACVQEELQQVPGKGEGILRLGITSDLSGLSSKQTKTTIDLDLPDEITIEITGDEGVQTETITMSDHSVNTGITLKTGTYTVKAYAGTNNPVQDQPYFESESKSVTIQPLQSTDVILTATVKNAWIVPNVDEDLKRHYTNWAVNLTVDGNQHQLISNESESNGLFVQARKSVDLTFDGVNVLGETKKTPLTTIQTEAAKKYVINCNPDVPQFSMGLTATATHTNDGSGNLNGTNVTFNVNTFEGLASLVQSWKVEVAYNETVIRTYEDNLAPDVEKSYTMNVVEGWPYVPQGSTLSASLTLKTGEVITPTIISFDLPKPTFGVTLSAYTSYDKYAGTNGITKNVTDANNCNAETLYGISGGFTGLSLDLVDNPNYGTKEFSITLDGADLGRFTDTSFGVNSVSLEDQTGLSWGSHTLKATMTFDGITVSKTNTHHITGLPYSYDLRSSETLPTGWTVVGNTDWNKNRGKQILYVYSTSSTKNYAKIFSPIFKIPTSDFINISYKMGVMFINTIHYKRSAQIFSGIVSSTDVFSKDNTSDITSSTYSSETLKTFTYENTFLTENNNRISVYHNEFYKADVTQYWMYLTTLDVLYR